MRCAGSSNFTSERSFGVASYTGGLLFSRVGLSTVQNSRPGNNVLSFRGVGPGGLFCGSGRHGRIRRLTTLLSRGGFRNVQGHLGRAGFEDNFTYLFCNTPNAKGARAILRVTEGANHSLVRIGVSRVGDV